MVLATGLLAAIAAALSATGAVTQRWVIGGLLSAIALVQAAIAGASFPPACASEIRSKAGSSEVVSGASGEAPGTAPLVEEQ